MTQEKKVTIRKFQYSDIPLKVKWINDFNNNQYLHYKLPLTIDNTKRWYDENSTKTNRYDATIILDTVPVGIIGLLNITNSSAEYYITVGETFCKGCGVATKASVLILDYAFSTLGLEKVYLTTEPKNTPAIGLYKKLGFRQVGVKNGQLLFEYTNPTDK